MRVKVLLRCFAAGLLVSGSSNGSVLACQAGCKATRLCLLPVTAVAYEKQTLEKFIPHFVHLQTFQHSLSDSAALHSMVRPRQSLSLFINSTQSSRFVQIMPIRCHKPSSLCAAPEAHWTASRPVRSVAISQTVHVQGPAKALCRCWLQFLLPILAVAFGCTRC